MRIPDKIFALRTLTRNATQRSDIWYIVESANWAIRSVGHHISKNLYEYHNTKSTLTVAPYGIRNSLLHFGSLPTLFSKQGLRKPHDSCRSIASIFHIATLKHQKKVLAAKPYIRQFHAPNSITATQLQALGITIDAITTIPLGIDIKAFTPAIAEMKSSMRNELEIPQDAFVIGSFQKDGIGWDEGNYPKLEKGPDIFIKVIRKAAKMIPVHVLLTGPARGYIEQNLAKHHIPFTSAGLLPNHQQVTRYYQTLDAYLITSRVEGGPLGLLEAWGSGIPVVTTHVGMAADHAKHEENALVASSEDTDTLANHLIRLQQEKKLAEQLSKTALKKAKQFDWSNITAQYYEKLYKPVLFP